MLSSQSNVGVVIGTFSTHLKKKQACLLGLFRRVPSSSSLRMLIFTPGGLRLPARTGVQQMRAT